MVELETLQDVFQNRAFRIPDFQRNYAWEPDQRRDLWEDLEDLERLAQPAKMHYTGTLVFHKGQNAPVTILGQTLQVLDIVDGQQRLTSLVILLCCIIDRLDALGIEEATDTAKNLRKGYIENKIQRLVLNGDANQFFLDHILNGSPAATSASPAHCNLVNAKNEFIAYLASRKVIPDSPEAVLADLAGLVSRVTNQLGFVVYEVESEAEVGVMFEVMNARGKPLTQLEKVKNYILYIGSKIAESPADLHVLTEEVNKTWQIVLRACFDARPEADEDQFLRYHWAIYPGDNWYEEKRRDKTFDIHKAVKKTFNLRRGFSVPELYAMIRKYLESLRIASNAYRDLLNPSLPNSFQCAQTNRDGLVEQAQKLQRLGRSATVMPLLIASYVRFGQEGNGDLQEVMRLAEVFSFRLTVLQKYANTGQSKAYDAAAEIMAGALTAPAAVARIKETIENYCTDAKLETELLDKEENFYDWDGIRYFLYEYEEYLLLQRHQRLLVNWEQFYRRRKEDTIEHVLPKGENTLSVAYWKSRFNHDQWRVNCHRLGNLTLTSWNGSYQNKGFDDKRGNPSTPLDAHVYRNSAWLMERELAGSDEWTESSIDDRQKKLASFALDRWRL